MEEPAAPPLKQLLMERISRSGAIPFSDYMAACLYEPGCGYYTSPGRKVGAEGDFYTSSNVHELFGRLLAREICRMWEITGSPTAFTVMEVGAGNGRLARDTLAAVADLAPALYNRLTYRLAEAEPSLEAVQREMLGPFAEKALWDTPDDLASRGETFTGCVLSNELIDAFPTHVVEMTPEGLREIFVTVAAGEFREVTREPSTPEVVRYLESFGAPLVVGQRAEVNLAARGWLQSVSNLLARGFVITIDYGYLAEELYAPHRKNGTLLCYYRHTTEENPYLRPGEQDITTHVNFSALMGWGAEFGLDTAWYGEQYRFLLATGMMQEMMALEAKPGSEEERLKNRLALKKLILPDGGMGDTFKVLVQAKGVPNPPLLCRQDWGKDL